MGIETGNVKREGKCNSPRSPSMVHPILANRRAAVLPAPEPQLARDLPITPPLPFRWGEGRGEGAGLRFMGAARRSWKSETRNPKEIRNPRAAGGKVLSRAAIPFGRPI